MSLRNYLGGAMVQASITLGLATQAFLVPRFLGQNEYGRTLAAVSLPILVQAGIETILFARTIQWVPEERGPALKRLWLDALFAAPALGLAAVLIALPSLRVVSWSEWTAFVLGAPLLLLVWIAATVLMGCAYARGRHAAIARAYFTSALVLPGSVYLLRGLGARAFLFGLFADKIVTFAMLFLDREVRALLRTTARLRASLAGAGRLGGDYLPVLTPRLTLLLLSPGLVAASAWLLAPGQLAGFKVSISFVTGAASLVPVSPHVLHAHWTGNSERLQREVWVVFGAAFLAGVVGAAGLFWLGDGLRGVVLHTQDPSLRRFDLMFLAVPFFVLIGPLSSLLIVLGRTRALALAFSACAAATLALALAVNPAAAFLGGTLVFVLGAASAVPKALVAG
jgi:hypothetical protein